MTLYERYLKWWMEPHAFALYVALGNPEDWKPYTTDWTTVEHVKSNVVLWNHRDNFYIWKPYEHRFNGFSTRILRRRVNQMIHTKMAGQIYASLIGENHERT